MIIEKVMNNNCVLASVNGQEVIISGPGVGYNKKSGMQVPAHPANKTFYVRNDEKDSLYKLIERVNIDYVFVSEKIVRYAEMNLDKKLNPALLLILADHISNAISRVTAGIQINNIFLDEIRTLYKAEYAISRDALTIIHQQFAIQLPDDEIGFIALHILNNYENTSDYESVRIIELSQKITDIIENSYGRKADRNTFNYSRFMMHLKYFACRVLSNETLRDKDIGDIYEQFLEKDLTLQRTIRKIEEYLNGTFSYELAMEEKLYLSIRIRILMD
ncbi:PRD domain-containing protein [Atlantibacter hermannii]|nr:PRD domain-containing protein [Atlantibacter hermannii]NBC99607.1 PRD domain-containing protein [Atlantibacter hermannii]